MGTARRSRRARTQGRAARRRPGAQGCTAGWRVKARRAARALSGWYCSDNLRYAFLMSLSLAPWVTPRISKGSKGFESPLLACTYSSSAIHAAHASSSSRLPVRGRGGDAGGALGADARRSAPAQGRRGARRSKLRRAAPGCSTPAHAPFCAPLRSPCPHPSGLRAAARCCARCQLTLGAQLCGTVLPCPALALPLGARWDGGAVKQCQGHRRGARGRAAPAHRRGGSHGAPHAPPAPTLTATDCVFSSSLAHTRYSVYGISTSE